MTGEFAPFAAVGHAAGQKFCIGDLQWTEAQFEAFVGGLRANFQGKAFTLEKQSLPQFEAIGEAIQRAQERASLATQPAESFREAHVTPPPDQPKDSLREAAKRFGMQETDSGLLVRIMMGGAGPRPTPPDTVIISISARAVNGTSDIKELSAKHVRAQVKNLLPGVAEGIQILALGGAALLVLPPHLSFGDSDWPSAVTQGTPLAFMVELHDILAADAAP